MEEGEAYRLTMMALSSMIHPEPMTMGPAMAKMVAFGWTMVPVGEGEEGWEGVEGGRTDPRRW